MQFGLCKNTYSTRQCMIICTTKYIIHSTRNIKPHVFNLRHYITNSSLRWVNKSQGYCCSSLICFGLIHPVFFALSIRMSWFQSPLYFISMATAVQPDSAVHLSSLPETWRCRQEEVQVVVQSNRWYQKKKVACQRWLCVPTLCYCISRGGRQEPRYTCETEINKIRMGSHTHTHQNSTAHKQNVVCACRLSIRLRYKAIC